MQFYKTLYVDEAFSPLTQTRTVWDRTLTDASKRRAALKKEGMRDIITAAVDVPTNKTDLSDWLNENVRHHECRD